MGNVYENLIRKCVKRRDHFGNPAVDGRITLQEILGRSN
jgi:hypothetical protein